MAQSVRTRAGVAMVDCLQWRATRTRIVAARCVRNDDHPTDPATVTPRYPWRRDAPDRAVRTARDAAHGEGRARAARAAARVRRRGAQERRRLPAILARDGAPARARAGRRA